MIILKKKILTMTLSEVKCKLLFIRDFMSKLCSINLPGKRHFSVDNCNCNIDCHGYGRRLSSLEMVHLCGQFCHIMLTHIIHTILCDQPTAQGVVTKIEATVLWYLEMLGQVKHVDKKPSRKIYLCDVTVEHIDPTVQMPTVYYVVASRNLLNKINPYVLVDLIYATQKEALSKLKSRLNTPSWELVIKKCNELFAIQHIELRKIINDCQVGKDDKLTLTNTVFMYYMVDWNDDEKTKEVK